MTTDIHFGGSTSLANDFAVKLLSGLLNLKVDDDAEGCSLVEVNQTNANFTTDRIPGLRAAFSRSRLSSLKIGDSETDLESYACANERRGVLVYATNFDIGGKECLKARFDVYREYLDGEEGQGWTRWRVKNLRVILAEDWVDLIPLYLDRDDPEPIWGTAI